MKYISEFVKKQKELNAKNVSFYIWLSENGTYISGKKKTKKSFKKRNKKLKMQLRLVQATKHYLENIGIGIND